MPLITKISEYAIRALVHMALQDGKRLLVKDLCRIEKLPPHFTRKALQVLNQHGYIQGNRGPGGGYVLTKSPSAIHLDKVIKLFEPTFSKREMVPTANILENLQHECLLAFRSKVKHLTVASLAAPLRHNRKSGLP